MSKVKIVWEESSDTIRTSTGHALARRDPTDGEGRRWNLYPTVGAPLDIYLRVAVVLHTYDGLYAKTGADLVAMLEPYNTPVDVMVISNKSDAAPRIQTDFKHDDWGEFELFLASDYIDDYMQENNISYTDTTVVVNNPDFIEVHVRAEKLYDVQFHFMRKVV